MYKVSRRSTLIPFFVVLAVGIGLSIFVPSIFHDTKAEIPVFALFPAEVAVALILSVLLFENAAPLELVKIAAVMLCIAFVDGAICNAIGRNTEWMPELVVQLNWVQLIAFNLTGMGGIMSMFSNVSEESTYSSGGSVTARDSAVKEQAKDSSSTPSKIDFSPQEAAAAAPAQDTQEILGQLDQNRIEQLEQSISTASPEHVSLESLFAEETEAASGGRKSEKLWASKEESKVTEDSRADARAEAKAEAKAEADKAKAEAEVKPEPVVEPVKEEVKAEPVLELNLTASEKTAAESAEASKKLFGDVSGDIDDIFNDMVGTESQKDFSPAEKAAAEAKALEAVPPPKVEEPAADAPKTEPPAPEAPAEAAQSFGPKMTEAGTSAKTAVKEFGKLSASATSKPDQATGTLKTIGQMLLDTAAVEKIIKKGEKHEKGSKWRVLTVDRGANLQALMDKIAAYEGVESALLMGKDGLLLSNTDSLSALKYVFGPLSLAMHSTTNLGTAKLQMGELRQAVLKTGDKVNILTDVGSAILAVFGDYNPATLDGLMEHINVAVAGSDAIDGEESDEAPDLSAEPAAKEATPPPPKEAAPAAPAGGVVNVSDNEVADLFDNLLAEESSDKKKEEAPAAPAPVAEKPAPAAAPAGGVVNVSDDEMTDLFDNLLSEDSADKKREKAEADAAAAAAAAAKPEPPAAKPGGLLNVSDNEVSDLFDNLLGGEAEPAAKKSMDFTPAEKAAEAEAAPAAPAAEAAPTAEAAPRAEAEAEAKPEKEEDKKKKIAADSKPPKQIKEFGKLSVQASAKDTGGEAGAMKAIGRQLIDVQAVENIIKAGEKREKIGSGLTTARVISAARGEGIKTLLSKIDTFEGVIGSLIVGHDGLVIASTLSGGIDKDMMGAMCTAIHSHLDVAVKKMDKGKLQQSVFVGGDNKLTVMTAVAVGVLAVFVDNAGVEKVDGLLTAIDNTVRG